MVKDYYNILGIPQNASKEDIKRAYHILAHQFHPDKNNGNEKRFKEIYEAYRILSNENSRSEYDHGYQPYQESKKQKANDVNKNKTSSQNSNKSENNDTTNFSINKSQLFWVLISIGLLIEIISSVSSGGFSFPRIIGQLLGGLVISKIIAHIFSVIKKGNNKEQQKVNWAIVFLIISIITLVVTLSRKSNSVSSASVTQQNPIDFNNNNYIDSLVLPKNVIKNISSNEIAKTDDQLCQERMGINSFMFKGEEKVGPICMCLDGYEEVGGKVIGDIYNSGTCVKTLATTTSFSTPYLYDQGCKNLDYTPFREGVAPTGTIDQIALISESKYQTISGTLSNNLNGGINVQIWKGKLSLPTTQESIYYEGSDHGGGLLTCFNGSSGIYYDKIFEPLLEEGDYTVGVFSYSNIYTNGGYQGNTTPILLATRFLKVLPK